MKNLFTIALIIILGINTNCFAGKGPTQYNFVVVLDLSDRLLTPGQVEKDKQLIQTAFNSFYERVKTEHAYILSKSSFKIAIPRQRNSSLNTSFYMDALSITLDKPTKNRLEIDSFKRIFPTMLAKLYKNATANKNKKSDFHGTDIWEYFSNQLKFDLVQGFENKVLVISDGYFDFESEKHVQKAGNLSTSTNFFKILRKLTSDKQEALLKSGQYGLIPITLPKGMDIKVGVVELNSKFPDHLNELNLLQNTWKYWMIRSGISAVSTMPGENLGRSNRFVQGFFST